MIIYHGSNVIVSSPRILVNGFYKDFGYGFYCTNIEKHAKRWALTKRGKSVVSSYEYIPNAALSQLGFDTMTEEWLDFVANCRLGKEHSYDIVEDRWRMIRSGITLKILLQVAYQEQLSGNWLSLSILHIKLYSVHKRH